MTVPEERVPHAAAGLILPAGAGGLNLCPAGDFNLTHPCVSYKSGSKASAGFGKPPHGPIGTTAFAEPHTNEATMKSAPKGPLSPGNAGSDREMRQELRSMGIRLTGRESSEDLLKMLKDELNRQWFRSAASGNVIRRRRKPSAE